MKMNTEIFIKKAKQVHKNKFNYSKTNYTGSRKKLTIICNSCGHEWETLPHNHLAGRGCKKCQYKNLPQNQPKTHKDFLIELKKTKFDNESFIILSEYKNKRTHIKVKCKKCKNISYKRPDVLLNGFGCKKCSYERIEQNLPMSVIDFEKVCKKIHENKYEYFNDFRGTRYKIKINCKKHGIFYQYASSHIQGYGCPICNESRGENEISKILTYYKIKFEKQKQFDGCKNKRLLPFDFYLPKLNTCIEYDGKQHFFPISYFGGNKRFNETKKHDNIKNEYCKQNNIKLIRIPFYEFKNIKDIIKKGLMNDKKISSC